MIRPRAKVKVNTVCGGMAEDRSGYGVMHRETPRVILPRHDSTQYQASLVERQDSSLSFENDKCDLLLTIKDHPR